MQRYSDAVTSVAGPSQSGVSVTVLTYPAGAVATIYSDNGVTPTANPTTTDQFGMFAFYAANGTYTLSISGLNITTRTYGPFILNDTLTTGTVTSVSVATANGLAGTVATATTTPAITLSTTITGTLQGNGTAISASKVTLTQPATGSTLTILDGKTLTANNSIVLTGTDSTTMTFPTTSATVARTDAGQTFTGTQAFGAITYSTLNGNTWAAGTGTLSIAAGKTLTASNSITIAGTDAKTLTVSNSIALAGTDSTTMTFPGASASIGYLNIPQNSQSAPYTTVLADSAKCIFHPASDANARTFTIDSNANVAYALGTVIEFINRSANNVTISITSDTLTWGPTGATGSRTLAQYGRASAEKIGSTEWLITGVGLT